MKDSNLSGLKTNERAPEERKNARGIRDLVATLWSEKIFVHRSRVSSILGAKSAPGKEEKRKKREKNGAAPDA